MPETTSFVPNPGTGKEVREVTTGASAGVQQVVSVADATSGVIQRVGASQHLAVNSGLIAQVVGTLTASSAGGAGITGSTGMVVADLREAGNFSLSVGGTWVGTLVFEITDDPVGALWFPIIGVRSDGSGAESGTGPTSSLVRMWNFAGVEAQYFRVRMSAFTSGTALVRVTSGGIPVDPSPTVLAQKSQNDTASRVSASTTSATLLAANPARLGFTVETDPGSSVCYVTCGTAAATSSNRTISLQPGDYWECPFLWAGAVQVIWAGTAGGASIHEFS